MSQRTTIANYSEEKKLIVWQKNIKINEADRASFIEHIVKTQTGIHAHVGAECLLQNNLP